MFKMGLHDPFGYLNTNYDQKKGRDHSRPLKVENCLDLLACKWHATYHWK
jgi:hypothetical protein